MIYYQLDICWVHNSLKRSSFESCLIKLGEWSVNERQIFKLETWTMWFLALGSGWGTWNRNLKITLYGIIGRCPIEDNHTFGLEKKCNNYCFKIKCMKIVINCPQAAKLKITMAKKKPYMAVFDAFDRLSLNENTKNQWPFERSSKVLQI